MTEEQYKRATKLMRWKQYLNYLICQNGTCSEVANALVKLCNENDDFKCDFDELIRKYIDGVQNEYNELYRMGKKVLHLSVSKQWFDMIKTGEKKEEYREIKHYWRTRLFDMVYDSRTLRKFTPKTFYPRSFRPPASTPFVWLEIADGLKSVEI